MSDGWLALFVGVILFAVLALGVSCELARYGECRRLHPWWYCVGKS